MGAARQKVEKDDRMVVDASQPTLRQLADEAGVSTKTIQRRLRELGAGPIVRRAFNLTKDELVDLYVTQKKTAEEIGELFGVSRATVYRALHRFEIDVRPGGGISTRARTAVLNPDLVRLIRKSAQDGVPQTEIAKVTGVSKQAIHQVVSYQTWRDIP